MYTKPMPRRWRRQRGLSIIELVMFIVIMGIAAVGVLQMLNLSTRSSADPVRRKQALMLAEALLEEVELARFTFCDPTDPAAATATSPAGCTIPEIMGPEFSSAVRPFDNVSDYITAAGGAQQAFLRNGVLVDAAGAAFGGNPIIPGSSALSGFTVTLAINPVVSLGPAAAAGITPVTSTAAPATMEALLLTVNVSYGSGTNDFVRLDGYRTRYAPNHLP
ncbi:prepilin-type N-terminal cleavage/methylation domain-containing protein [Oxalobacteraceae bacterium]|nr:prepilin-type N-terminal cleavage/methylation domain-containing protein [Oxalobacteraceae bacterium]